MSQSQRDELVVEEQGAGPPAEESREHAPIAKPLDSQSRAAIPTKPASVQPDVAHLWLRRGDQLFVGVSLIVVVLLLGAYWGRMNGWGESPIRIERSEASRYEFQIDINRATWVEWIQLDGIGETLARRIVADRESSGPFRTVDDLLRVKGIGAKSLDRIRPWLRVRTEPLPPEAPSRTEASRSAPAEGAQPDGAPVLDSM